MAAPASKRQKTSLSPSSSSSSSITSFPTTSQLPCHHAKEHHIQLPHMESKVWKDTTQALEPLAMYYVEHILTTERETELSVLSIQETAHALPSSSSSSSPSDSRSPIWSSHYVPHTTEASPITSSQTCIEFLRTLRHPTLKNRRMTGKSLLHTLDHVMHPRDRAHFLQVLLPYLAYRVLQLPTLFPLDGLGHCLPQLMRGIDASVSLSSAQCATLFACQLFSLFPSRENRRDELSTWPTCNFEHFFSVTRSPMSGKHLLMLNYVARIEDPRGEST